MKKEFIEKVKRDIIVDTKNYRYIYDGSTNCINRINKNKLDTTAVLFEWETIKEL